MKLIERPLYIDKIKPYIGLQLVKVLVGQRRVGKSSILKLIKLHILEENPNANCIFIDKELHKFKPIKNDSDLLKYLQTIELQEFNYLFIDELQEIEHFERAIRSLLNEGIWDIYCTGSNASMLSGDIATMLSGRQLVVKIHGLSYSEFLDFRKTGHSTKNLDKYLTFGGLPYIINLPDDEQIIWEYLTNIYNTILFRDIVSRHSIRDTGFLENLIAFLADNTGSLFSAKKISEYLKSQQLQKSSSIVNNYIDFLQDAFFLNRVKRKDIQGKKIFEIGEKIYFQDLGLRNLLSGDVPGDKHKILENTVLNHLLMYGWKVFTGKSAEKEIDFIAEKNNETVYIQVTYLLNEQKTIDREFGNLLEIQDNYPKYVISQDAESHRNTYKGIIHLSISQFLLEFK
jgi:predicted AAA+ superfamily ATPase